MRSIVKGRRRLARVCLAAALTVGGAVAMPDSPAEAQSNPYQKGPGPTQQSIERDGPFAVSEANVGRQSGFGGATIYYPTDTGQGTFGGVAFSPGFTESRSYLDWLARRVATHGFVVINIDTLGILDQPGQRADQLQAALDYLVNSSQVANRVDRNRLAVGGHSMGGGGTIEAADDNPALQAAVAFQPWHTNRNWGGVQVPTMIQGAQNDAIAGVAGHSEPFYQSLPAGSEKAYAEIRGANHFVSGSFNNAPTSRLTISWLKRWVDNDTRYDQFLCPAPSGFDLSEYRDSCPHPGGGDTPPPTDPPPTTPPPDECEWWEWWCWFF